jgi:hypothetical protein
MIMKTGRLVYLWLDGFLSSQCLLQDADIRGSKIHKREIL